MAAATDLQSRLRARDHLLGMTALWTLTGMLGVVTVLGMFSIGIFVLPLAFASFGVALWLTIKQPSRWPSTFGLGLAAALGLAWFGVVMARSSPSEMSCSGSSDGPTICTSDGVPMDPNPFDLVAAAPWFGLALVAFVGTAVLMALFLVPRTRIIG